MQRIFNYGSFLQAYGLMEILKELNCHVEFVDYRVGECLIPADGKCGRARKVKKGLEVLKYHAPLKEKVKFILYKKNYAARYFPYLGLSDQMNYIPELDLLVIGSDEVFNCVQSNVNVGFSPELFGVDNRSRRVISYAASCGNTTLEKLEKYHVKEKVGKWLSEFDALSVRDSNTGNVVTAVTGKSPSYHLDPVLVYDFVGKCKKIPDSVPEKYYIIVYGYSGRFSKKECKAIREFANRQRVKILCIGGVQDCCDSFVDCSPFEVIAYFQHAEAVITDTFHGTILSIITHKRFVSFVRSDGYGNEEKLTDLLERLHMSEHIVRKIEDLQNMLKTEFSYDKTDQIILKERKRTYEYLKKQIQQC